MTELKLEIDKNALDQEWMDQPELYHAWAQKAADAQLNYDRAKSNLDVVKAELDRDIRDDPVEYGIGKTTEKVVENTVTSQPEFKAATEAVHKAKHDLDVAKAAVDALEHRKRALTMLVELWIRDYYSEPKTDAKVTGDWEKKRIRSKGKVRRERDKENGD